MNSSNGWSTLLQAGNWWRTVALVLALNLGFCAFTLLGAAIPAEHLRERVVEAFESGSLTQRDRIAFDRRIGWHQYNDCLIVQMVSNEGDALLKAVGPLAYYRDDFHNMCSMVSELVNREVEPEQLESFRYTRYWHGHNALTAVTLYAFDFSTVRTLFRAAAYLSVLGLVIAALRSDGHLRLLGLAMATFGGLFWGLPYYAQSPSHGPGDTAVVLGFVVLLVLARRGFSVRQYMLLCSAFGAALAYMEFLTGLLPTAAAFLLPLGYFAAGSLGAPQATLGYRWRFAIVGLAGFGLGVILTVLVKQLLAAFVIGWQVVDAFTNNLDYYLQTPDTELNNRLLVSAYTVVAIIRRWGATLAYGSSWGALFLFVSSAVAWTTALVLAVRSRHAASVSAVAACAAGASLIMVWIFVLPTHTFYHHYMVRIMIAPLALGWVALLVQWRAGRGVVADASQAVSGR